MTISKEKEKSIMSNVKKMSGKMRTELIKICNTHTHIDCIRMRLERISGNYSSCLGEIRV